MCDFNTDCDGRMVQGACSDCGAHPQARDMREGRPWEERCSGGAGAATQPLSNGEYKRQMEKLAAKAGK